MFKPVEEVGMGDYYDRKAEWKDGGPAFATKEDEANEAETQAALEAAWNVTLHRYGGRFNPIDWYAVRDGRIVAYLELKSRSHDAEKYPTVFLNLRKWLALTNLLVYAGTPSYFVVRFASGEIYWIAVDAIDVRENVKVGGCSRRVKSKTDREPVIHVPVAEMHRLRREGR